MDNADVQAILTRIRAFSLAIHERIRQEVPPGFSMQHMLIMKTLANDGAVKQGDLVNRLGISKGAVSQTVSSLEERGLVERRRDAQDGRIQWVHLTPAAQAFKTQTEGRMATLFADLFDQWSDDDAQRMIDLLDRLVERARAKADQAPPLPTPPLPDATAART